MLLRNYKVFNDNPGREFGGVTDATKWMKSGSVHNFFYGDSSISGETDKAGFPVGYGAGGSWALPPKAGGMSSHKNANVSFSHTVSLVGGLPGSGSTTLNISVTGTGGLIVSGSGTATVTLTPSATIISVASGSGSATVTLSGSALIGALAGLSAGSTISLSPTATIKAIGYLAGISSNETEFSADNLARAVWDALATDFNTPGTMGELVNDAGAAGNPWSAATSSNNSPGTFGEFVQGLPTESEIAAALLDLANGVETGRTVREALRLILAALAGKLSGAGTNQITIRDSNDTKDRIVATVDVNGNRSSLTYDDT